MSAAFRDTVVRSVQAGGRGHTTHRIGPHKLAKLDLKPRSVRVGVVLPQHVGSIVHRVKRPLEERHGEAVACLCRRVVPDGAQRARVAHGLVRTPLEARVRRCDGVEELGGALERGCVGERAQIGVDLGLPELVIVECGLETLHTRREPVV